jgi:hypothetical protein
MRSCGLDSSDYGQGPIADSSEHGNELSGSIKAGNTWLAGRPVGRSAGRSVGQLRR